MSGHVTADDLDNLRHALGIDSTRPRKSWGFRNYFTTSANDPSFARLVAAGWARLARAPSELTGGDAVFVATREGCRAIGMTESEILRMEKNR